LLLIRASRSKIKDEASLFSPRRIRKPLTALLLVPTLFGCATSFEAGSPQGGRCKGSDLNCVAYIQEITSGGGKVVSMVRGAVWTGRADFVQETQSITNQHCSSRGFTRAHLSPPIRLPDMMVFRQTQDFTCVNDAPRPSLQPQQAPQIQAPPQGNPSSVPIGEAREKCKDLGFKEKTEAFGTCVLRLMK